MRGPLTQPLTQIYQSKAYRGMYFPTCVIVGETALEDGLVLHSQGTPLPKRSCKM